MQGGVCQHHIIGISGATCSGKTTLSKRLHKVLPNVVVFNQDQYFWPTDNPHHVYIEELNHANWELVTSLNMEGLLNDIKAYLKGKSSNEQSFIIIEGIVILNYRPIAELVHQKFYITLTKEQCWERRRIRTYDPPDPSGYFDKCVWPMHVKHLREFTEEHQDVVFLDGALSKDAVFETAFHHIQEALQAEAQQKM